MAENSKTYSQHDIKRYLQQQMLPEEMHAFETALMNDPFLSDALDGFTNSDWQQANDHLSTIETVIRKEKSNTKIIPFISEKTSWWRVAAMILLIATGGIVTYSVMHQSTPGKEINTEVAANKITSSSPENDSVKADEKPLAKIEPGKAIGLYKNKGVPPMVIKSQDVPMASLNNDEVSSGITSMGNAAKPASAADMEDAGQPSRNDEALSKKEMPGASAQLKQTNEFKGQVVAPSGEPIAGATVKIADKNVATATDANGYFTLKSADSIVKVDVNTIGYSTAKAALKKNEADNKIAVEPSSNTLSEVVVTSMGLKRKATGKAYSVTKVPANDISKTKAEPLIGINAYQEYIKKQVDSTLIADGKTPVNTAIDVEFSIDKNGHPVKLKVLNNTNGYYKKKAIKIINDGPLWKTTNKDAKAKVIVKF